MSIKEVLLFFMFTLLFLGSYQFYWSFITKKAYKLRDDCDKDLDYFDFCCKEYDTAIWKWRQKSKARWFYHSNMFKIFVMLKGISLLSLYFVLFILLFLLNSSEYASWIDVKM